MIEHLNKRSTELLPANMNQTLSHLLLAVNIMGFYKRANLQVSYDDEYTIKYSDRTEYSAYAEQCRDDTELGRGLTKEQMETISFNEFAQTVQHKWINSNKSASNVIDQTTKCKFRSRDVNTGHWRLTLCRTLANIRDQAQYYIQLVDHGNTTTDKFLRLSNRKTTSAVSFLLRTGYLCAVEKYTFL